MPAPGDGAATVAPLGRRFAAQLVDGGLVLLCYIAGWVVSLPLVFLTGNTSSVTTYNVGSFLAGLIPLAGFLAGLALYLVGVGRLGQSIGKRLLGVRVQDVASGRPIGVGRAVLRWLVLGLMGFPCYLGYLTFFMDGTGRNRALHDRAASDVVVTASPVPFGQSVRDVVGALAGRS